MFWNFPATLLLSCWQNRAMSALHHPYNATNNTRWPLTPRRDACRCHYERSIDVCRTVETWHHPCVSRNWRPCRLCAQIRTGRWGKNSCPRVHLPGSTASRYRKGPSGLYSSKQWRQDEPDRICKLTRLHGWQNTNIYNTEEEILAMFWIFECILILYPHFSSSSGQVLPLIVNFHSSRWWPPTMCSK